MRRPGAVLLAVVLLAGGCDRAAPAPPPEPLPVAWQPVGLPLPPGGTGQPIVRDAAYCPGAWFLAGGVRDAQGGTRPAAWTSPDAHAWRSLTLDARTYYGQQNVLYTIACKDGRAAAVGAKTGGAHANPRTSSWHQSPDGVLHEVTAPFELFGGPQAVNVARMDAGPDGFLIAGNRMTGAAVWRSPDAARFGIVERAPALASDAAGETWAFDSTDTTDGWLVAGGFLPKGRIDRDPIGWRSADGVAWQRVPAAGATDAYEELQRVTLLDGVPVAVGLAGQAFGAWRLADGAWQPAGRFGSAPRGAAGTVRALTVAGPRLYAVTGDGTSYALWASDDQGRSWRTAVLPARVSTGPESTVAVAGGAGVAVLLTDDGTVGRTYVADTGA